MPVLRRGTTVKWQATASQRRTGRLLRRQRQKANLAIGMQPRASGPSSEHVRREDSGASLVLETAPRLSTAFLLAKPAQTEPRPSQPRASTGGRPKTTIRRPSLVIGIRGSSCARCAEPKAGRFGHTLRARSMLTLAKRCVWHHSMSPAVLLRVGKWFSFPHSLLRVCVRACVLAFVCEIVLLPSAGAL